MQKKSMKKVMFIKPKKKVSDKMKNIRILYKKVGQVPEVKIISLWKLKKAIIKKKLEIIPYETLYIICNNKKRQKYLPINIVLDFRHIAGDFILIDIDKNTRELKGISQDDVIWYLKDLSNKTFCNSKKSFLEPIRKKYVNFPERSFEPKLSTGNDFEQSLLNILTNMELTLVNLLKGDTFVFFYYCK